MILLLGEFTISPENRGGLDAPDKDSLLRSRQRRLKKTQYRRGLVSGSKTISSKMFTARKQIFATVDGQRDTAREQFMAECRMLPNSIIHAEKWAWSRNGEMRRCGEKVRGLLDNHEKSDTPVPGDSRTPKPSGLSGS